MPNITIGPLVVAALRPITDLPLDVHLVRFVPFNNPCIVSVRDLTPVMAQPVWHHAAEAVGRCSHVIYTACR